MVETSRDGDSDLCRIREVVYLPDVIGEGTV